MPRPSRIRSAGAKYHVTTRGNARQTILHGREGYERYLEQLTSALDLDGVVLYACALLGNHTHLLVETPRGKSQREIGARFGYNGNGAVGKQRAKLRDILGNDRALARRLMVLRKRLSES